VVFTLDLVECIAVVNFVVYLLVCGTLTVAHVCEYLRVTRNSFDVFALITSASLVVHMTGKKNKSPHSFLSVALRVALLL